MQTQTPEVPATPIALTRTADRSITVHALSPEGLVDLGTFRSTADAWRAVDELDMGVVAEYAAAA
ncbi:MAG: hypothetical protein JWM31_2772 [Solirubrobacterales bacterium]|nr:hypothetical protein [Solirubrobacterales bacterium]